MRPAAGLLALALFHSAPWGQLAQAACGPAEYARMQPHALRIAVYGGVKPGDLKLDHGVTEPYSSVMDRPLDAAWYNATRLASMSYVLKRTGKMRTGVSPFWLDSGRFVSPFGMHVAGTTWGLYMTLYMDRGADTEFCTMRFATYKAPAPKYPK